MFLILLALLFILKRMKLKITFLFFGLLYCLSTTAQYSLPQDSLYATAPPKRPWRAALETFGINTGVWAFDRYILQEDFAKINLHTIHQNIKTGFVWDNDQFSTNLFAHPYHGSLYFNTARSNGLNFWESAPYAFGGSLMWEIVAEREPPAMNDLIATTVGGIALGEFTHRMSSLVLDDSKRGFPRFMSEFIGTLISPIRGLNRMITGDMWKVKHKNYKYHDYEKIPVNIEISSGNRYLASDTRLFKGEHNPYLEFRTVYGDPSNKENNQPYDYLTASITFGLSPNQPLISNVNLLGKLWSTPIKTSEKADITFGIYQHFNFYDSEEVNDGSGLIPYKISEAASVGPGLICRFPNLLPKMNVEQDLFLSGILLGGGLTDYYHVIDRNYNLGSGYSVKSRTFVQLGKLANIDFNAHLYQIFTWKGYEKKDLATTNPLYLNAQGDKGNTIFLVLNPIYELSLTKHFKASFEIAYYLRQTHYSYHKDVHSKTVETRLGITYKF